MNWKGRKSTWHCISLFIDFPPFSFFPSPPIFPSFFSITYYLFCIDTFLSLCLEKGIFMIMNNSHFSMRKIFSFSFFLVFLLFSEKHLATKGKVYHQVNVFVFVFVLLCIKHIVRNFPEKENLFFYIFNKENFVHNDIFFAH